METYIALLRGINVSGQKIIKMELLRGIFEAMGFDAVRTYIQSGNVIFRTKKTREQALLKKIESTLEAELGYRVDVLLRTPAALQAIVQSHPYGSIAAEEDRKLYVVFVHSVPDQRLQQAFLTLETPGESFVFAGREIYISIKKDHPKPVFTNMLLEKKLKSVATTRNWATVNKLLLLSTEV
ncbi:Uncharacterized conserved protein, DUF1697 family [Chitinophaga jiangningensis]|uniref:Uncharacterized conserved protein, DUF1697 family n=1 Tax=Chitinophaga jiangningensis TaxID=1419482 RepID=A0A1M7MX61_9BACT|nr:DUF1697 domain-containing protein [Chitinophaga jiangningensis]SHM95758.1 Uncharacterized conserved protein, DUF1697 family [Chitinophaga jiangningensis]